LFRVFPHVPLNKLSRLDCFGARTNGAAIGDDGSQRFVSAAAQVRQADCTRWLCVILLGRIELVNELATAFKQLVTKDNQSTMRYCTWPDSP